MLMQHQDGLIDGKLPPESREITNILPQHQGTNSIYLETDKRHQQLMKIIPLINMSSFYCCKYNLGSIKVEELQCDLMVNKGEITNPSTRSRKQGSKF